MHASSAMHSFQPLARRYRPARAGQAGFSLIELLVVLAIMGLIMGLVGPRVLNYLTDARAKTARVQIESFANALDLYFMDAGRYPSSQEGLGALVRQPPGVATWNGPYLKGNAVPNDPWGNPFVYRSPGANGPYDVISHGSDGREGGNGAAAEITNAQRADAGAFPGAGGYMLLDLALALTIMLLLFAVAWPVVGSGTSDARHAAVAMDIATLLRVDRSAASSRGQPTGTRFDLGGRTVTGSDGRRVHVPGDVAMTVTTSATCMVGAQRFAIVFAPNGTSCGGVVTLSKGVRSYAIKINWLSGMVDVVSDPKA